MERARVELDAFLRDRGRTLRFFRFPFLREGDTEAKVDAARDWLERTGQRNLTVTIDDQDWSFEAAWVKASREGDEAALAAVSEDYLASLRLSVRHHERSGDSLLGRVTPQVLLLHANAVGAGNWDRLFTWLEQSGHRFASADEVLADPAFAELPRLPATHGFSLWDRLGAVRRDGEAREAVRALLATQAEAWTRGDIEAFCSATRRTPRSRRPPASPAGASRSSRGTGAATRGRRRWAPSRSRSSRCARRGAPRSPPRRRGAEPAHSVSVVARGPAADRAAGCHRPDPRRAAPPPGRVGDRAGRLDVTARAGLLDPLPGQGWLHPLPEPSGGAARAGEDGRLVHGRDPPVAEHEAAGHHRRADVAAVEAEEQVAGEVLRRRAASAGGSRGRRGRREPRRPAGPGEGRRTRRRAGARRPASRTRRRGRRRGPRLSSSGRRPAPRPARPRRGRPCRGPRAGRRRSARGRRRCSCSSAGSGRATRPRPGRPAAPASARWTPWTSRVRRTRSPWRRRRSTTPAPQRFRQSSTSARSSATWTCRLELRVPDGLRQAVEALVREREARVGADHAERRGRSARPPGRRGSPRSRRPAPRGRCGPSSRSRARSAAPPPRPRGAGSRAIPR